MKDKNEKKNDSARLKSQAEPREERQEEDYSRVLEQYKDEIQNLRNALEEERLKNEKISNQLLYLQADLDNLQKRLTREISEKAIIEKERLVLEVLQIREDLARSLDAFHDTADKRSLLEGLEMIKANLDVLLKTEGVSEIETIGKIFDPEKHEAVSYVEREDCEENMITAEIRKGYTIRGKVIRPSMVEIAKRASQNQGSGAVSKDA